MNLLTHCAQQRARRQHLLGSHYFANALGYSEGFVLPGKCQLVLGPSASPVAIFDGHINMVCHRSASIARQRELCESRFVLLTVQVAQSECSRVADPLQCPFNLPSSSRLAVPPRGTRLLSVSGGDAAWLEDVHSSRLRGDTTSTRAIGIRALEMSGHDRRLPAIETSGRESTAKCCYTQEVVDTCE